MASVDKRLKILTQTEIDELYAAPIFNAEDRDFFFDMDENEKRACDSRKSHSVQLYFVLLLGYFRRKPIILSELSKQYREDLDFISAKYFKAKPVSRKNITSTERFRIYDKILDVFGLKKFGSSEQKNAFAFVSRIASTSVDPRYLFDELFMYLSTAKVCGQVIPAAGGGYFRQYPYLLSRWLFTRASRNQTKPQIFYLHPWVIDPDQPRVPNASWFSNFRHYSNLSRCMPRLERMINDFQFGTISQSLGSAKITQELSINRERLRRVSLFLHIEVKIHVLRTWFCGTP